MWVKGFHFLISPDTNPFFSFLMVRNIILLFLFLIIHFLVLLFLLMIDFLILHFPLCWFLPIQYLLLPVDWVVFICYYYNCMKYHNPKTKGPLVFNDFILYQKINILSKQLK